MATPSLCRPALALLVLAGAPALALADAVRPGQGITPTPTPEFVQDAPSAPSMPRPGRVPAAAAPDATAVPPAAQHDHRHDDPRHAMTVADAASVQWSDGPPALPRGVRLALLDGDPFAPGPFVLRLKMPPGYTIPPHWHSHLESVTVISGTLLLGMGDKVDLATATTLTAGGFHAIPAQQPHFAFTREGAVVQIHGDGPFHIAYLNPADNPAAADPAPARKRR